MFKHIYLGTSIAISWAWGTSLILGMEIARTKGLESFLIWATANCLTLAVFGILYKKGILRSEVLDQKGVKIVANLIQLFCLIIQLKILNETLQSFFNPIDSYVVTLFFSGGLVLWMYRKGLAASILTDWYQGIGTLLVLGSMALICFMSQEAQATPLSSLTDISWGLWSGCILLSGIMTDIQHWQRAEVNKKGYAFECASIFFAIYLSLVFFLSKYQFDETLNLLLLLAVIGVTTSTIDSIAVALHRDFGRKLGTWIAMVICFGYQILVDLSVLNLWSYFGIIRVGLALYILYWCVTQRYAIKLRSGCRSIQ